MHSFTWKLLCKKGKALLDKLLPELLHENVKLLLIIFKVSVWSTKKHKYEKITLLKKQFEGLNQRAKIGSVC